MKQITNINFQQLTNNLIYPIYQNQTVNPELSKLLDCDLNQIIDKETKITTINTLNKLNFPTITFIGLGNPKQITTKKIKELAYKIKLN